MPAVIGRGPHARWVYPQSPGRGSSATFPPLTRQRFIDGGTSNPGSGSAASPYATIASFLAGRGNVSTADADANYVGWVTPKIGGYTENLSFPPYASTELRADSNPGVTDLIIGNITWPNVGGAFAAPNGAYLSLHNLTVLGSIVVTDDVGAPDSLLVLSADEIGQGGASVSDVIDTSACTKLAAIIVTNMALANGVNAGTTDDSAALTLLYSSAVGSVLARTVNCIGATLACDVITTVAVTGQATFRDCAFAQSSNTVLTAPGGALFDGPSWRSFLAAGGVRSVATTVLVTGGYSGGIVQGANLPTGAGPTNVSLNGTGASGGYTGMSAGNFYASAGLVANSVVRLLTGGGELNGDTQCITKTDLAAFSLTVQNNAGGTIGVIPPNSRGSIIARFNGADWIFQEGGSLVG